MKRGYYIYFLPFQSYWKSFSNNLICFHSKNQIWVLSTLLFTFFQANHEYHQESISSSSSSSCPSTDEDNFTSIHKQSQYKIISGLKLQGCKWLAAIMRGILLLWYSHLNQWFSTLAAHWNHLRSFLKFCCPALNPRHSNLIGQEYSPNVKWFKCSPGDFNVQPSVKAHQTKTTKKTPVVSQEKSGLLSLLPYGETLMRISGSWKSFKLGDFKESWGKQETILDWMTSRNGGNSVIRYLNHLHATGRKIRAGPSLLKNGDHSEGKVVSNENRVLIIFRVKVLA